MKDKGSVERLPSGRWRARRRDPDGKLRTIPRKGATWATQAEAQAALDAPEGRTFKGLTLASYGRDTYIPRRKTLGRRDIRTDESRWSCHFEADPLGAIPLRELKARDVRDWRDRMLSRVALNTVKNAINLLRCCLDAAVEDELCARNVARDVVIPRRLDVVTEDPWTVLDPEEQIALLRSVDPDEWHTVAAALGLGLRNSEQWRLRWEDVDLEAGTLVVRYSVGGHGTKGGKPRRLHLFGLGLDALEEAAQRRKKGCPWVFPSPRTNGRRFDSSHPTRWAKWLEAAGITRHVRWYDLRHTCATSLIGGWWGKRWTLEQVQAQLGHESRTTTERYAHLLDDTLASAARGTGGVEFHGPRPKRQIEGANFQIRTGDLRFTNPRRREGFSGLAVAEFHARSTRRDSEASALLLEATALACQPGKLPQLRVLELMRRAGVALGLLDGGDDAG